jgi:hypothetical protein
VNEGLRRKVFERDAGACWHCGATDGLSIQHRMNKQMGGSRLRDRLDNLITFCLEGNQRMESDAEFANIARDYGWKLPTWTGFSSPVFCAWERRWYVLDEKGNKMLGSPPNYLI